MDNNTNRATYLNAIPDGTIFMVRGTLKYSRLAKKIEGEALQKDIARQKQMNRNYIVTKPYTTVTICDAQIVPNASLTPDIAANVNAYLNRSLYQSSAEGYTGFCFSVNHTGLLPWVGARQADNSVKQIALTHELASEQPVTLVLHVYTPKNFTNHGLGLTGVIVESPTVQYYAGGLDAKLRAAGIIFDEPLVPQEQINNPNVSAPEGPMTEVPYEAQTMAPPVTPPTAGTDPFTAVPPQAQGMYGYGQQTAPVQQTMPFAQPANAFPMPEPVPQTATQPLPQQGSEAGGIRYDASDRQYH